MRIISTQFTLETQSLELYLAGCDGVCKDCFSPETWDFNQGAPYEWYTLKIENKIKKFNNLIKWVWVLGGEPLLNDNLPDLLDILQGYKKPIVLFTRFELDGISDSIKDRCDYIKTGMYDKTKLSKNEYYGIELASSNQRVWKKEGLEWI